MRQYLRLFTITSMLAIVSVASAQGRTAARSATAPDGNDKTEFIAYLSDLEDLKKQIGVKTWPTITIDFMQSYQAGEPRAFDDRFFDFEVKATTNNFRTLVYYYLSTSTNQVGPYYAYNFCDKDAKVIYKNAEFVHRTRWGDFQPGDKDGRVWLKKHDLASIYDCVADPSLAYVTSVDLIVSTNQVRWVPGVGDVLQDVSWMHENNTNLQWAVIRIGASDMERISSLTHPFYNATPVWDRERKNWRWAIYEMDRPRGGYADVH